MRTSRLRKTAAGIRYGVKPHSFGECAVITIDVCPICADTATTSTPDSISAGIDTATRDKPGRDKEKPPGELPRRSLRSNWSDFGHLAVDQVLHIIVSP